jgi:hypothetical protein
VFNWDRGVDVPATNPTSRQIVDFLTAGIAEYVYPINEHDAGGNA